MVKSEFLEHLSFLQILRSTQLPSAHVPQIVWIKDDVSF